MHDGVERASCARVEVACAVAPDAVHVAYLFQFPTNTFDERGAGGECLACGIRIVLVVPEPFVELVQRGLQG